MPPSSTSSTSSSPPPLSPNLGKGRSKKSKGAPAQGQGLNADPDPHLPYEPPDGAVLLKSDGDLGEFDWDEFKKNDDMELWLIRVPDGVKPKHLESVSVDLPSSPSKTVRVGNVNCKRATFNIWCVGDADDNPPVGGEEIKHISCLLPRKKRKGHLYAAPKPVARHLVITALDALPTPDPSLVQPSAKLEFKRPPRYSYPKEYLKHKFLPCGSETAARREEDIPMDVMDDRPAQTNDAEVGTVSTMDGEKKKKKKNKRVVEPVPSIPTPGAETSTAPTTAVSPDVREIKQRKRKGSLVTDGNPGSTKRRKKDQPS